MGPSYDIIGATLDGIRISDNERRDGRPPYKYYVIANGDDGLQYQIKFCEPGHRHNVNELIAHYIGSCCNMPIIEGKMLHFSDGEMAKLRTKLDQLRGKIRDVDLGVNKDDIFFGIEWKQNVVRIANQNELMHRVGEASNRESFWSLYSFDQYLKNFDRHPQNHLVFQSGNSRQYRIIDHDRIFRSTDWSHVSSLAGDFSPIMLRPYHKFLYHQVTNNTVRLVHFYAGHIGAMREADIDDMCGIIRDIYNVSPPEIAGIRLWMTERKSRIVMKCFENENHFPNVSQRGLYATSG